MDSGRENGSKLASKSEPKSILALKQKNQLNVSPLVPNWVRRVQDGRQNVLKIEVQDSMPLGIDFSSILVAFGRQVGQENRAKMLPKSL